MENGTSATTLAVIPSTRMMCFLQEDSGFKSSPILLPGPNQNASPGSRSMDTRMQQREYQPHNNQMPPRLPEIPEIGQQGLPAVAGHAQPGPPPILTNIPMEGSRSSLMSSSQRAENNNQQPSGYGQDYRTPRVNQHQLLSEGRPVPDRAIVNDMGNQFVLQSNNNGPGSDGAQSERSYRHSPARSRPRSA
ncbi:hypothetical protein B0O80DRAFT_502951 [Mortierella sp. GBAus27b]|nr:hypothetical protein B0O80DRAFT_502951 [Mortierella sp. GBAus27b]